MNTVQTAEQRNKLLMLDTLKFAERFSLVAVDHQQIIGDDVKLRFTINI